MLRRRHLLLFLFFPLLGASPVPNASLLLLPHVHSDPDSVACEVQRQVESSRRLALLEANEKEQQCLTGNPIDDCWRCYGTDWQEDRQRLADCGIGFGRAAMGGKGGPFYVVSDPSDPNPVNPPPGTLRYGVIQEGPLWITFAGDMNIRLNEELIVNSFKTIDGRGAVVHITGGGCITLQHVSNIIIHNVHIHHCVPAGEANVRSSPTHYGWRTRSDGDGISIYNGRQIWIDHCALSYCTDGLIDAIMGSTAITISNSYFSHHNEVMLLGHTDDYLPDSGMQVTIAFNRFGEQVVQRMPRCRRGYFHVVNNDYTAWEMYAIGGSANPTINSQGNRYVAPSNPNAKEANSNHPQNPFFPLLSIRLLTSTTATAGDEAGGHGGERVERVELEDGGGRAGERGILRALRRRPRRDVRQGGERRPEVRDAHRPAHHGRRRPRRRAKVIAAPLFLPPTSQSFFIHERFGLTEPGPMNPVEGEGPSPLSS